MSGRTLRWLMSLGRADAPGATLGDADERGAPRLIIIRHHRVYRDGETPLYRLGVSERVLEAQLEMLNRAGLAAITVEEGVERLVQGTPGRRVALSCDHRYADNVERALPLLRKHGARATLYVTAGLVDARRAPWWDELEHVLSAASRPTAQVEFASAPVALALGSPAARARTLASLLPYLRVVPDEQRRRLDAVRAALGVDSPAPCALAGWEQVRFWSGAGMEIGAHTLTHPFLSILAPAAQAHEIAASVELIAQRVGVRPTGFAYPGGDYGAQTIEAARAAGLRYAVCTRPGLNDDLTPRFELLRRGLPEAACLGPGGRFSRRLAMAELEGAFDRLRDARASANGNAAAARHAEVTS